MAPRSLMNAPTLGAVCAASPMLLIAFPIGCKVVAIFFAFPRIPVAPLAISMELRTEESPAFFPPGRRSEALENKVPRPEEIRCFPSPLIQSVKGCPIKVSQAMSILPNKSAFCHSSDAVMVPITVFMCAAFLSTLSIRLFKAVVTAGIVSVIESTNPLI